MTPTKVLVTGGAGYIGSTVCSALKDAGHIPIVLDSLMNGYEQFARGRSFYKGDIADSVQVGKVFDDHPDLDFAIHCAALTVVPDSVERPYDYYRNNVVVVNAVLCSAPSNRRSAIEGHPSRIQLPSCPLRSAASLRCAQGRRRSNHR